MSDVNSKCMEVFPHWLRTLDEDVQVIVDVLKAEGASDSARRALVGGVNYLFKSLDLIPDGIDDIGYLDDAFVIRVTAKDALEGDLGKIEAAQMGKLGALGNDVDLIKELLGNDLFDRFEKYCRSLAKGAARGRTVEDICENADVFKEFAGEAAAFVSDYQSPGFSQDAKNLIKLKAFLEAKLPQ